jgi:phosphoserine phosphatase
MNARGQELGLSAEDLGAILEVTRALAAPFDLLSMLAEVTRAACRVLRAERASVWLHDAAADELVLEVAADIRHVRVPVGAGLVGVSARDRRIVNVADCYADPRFDPAIDRRSGFRTRCSLTLPLIDHRDALVGVMQVLNKADGVFGAADEMLAAALAAQCAVALQRVRLTEAQLESEKLRQELEVARIVQTSGLPAAMPRVAGYDLHGVSRPAAQTGGDTFDLGLVGDRLLVVLGDATGHGIGPALSVTQMQAMLRIAFRLGAELQAAFTEVNDQLAESLPDDRFITAFVGLLDPSEHRMTFHSGGQAPILHWRAASAEFESHRPTSFPLGAMPLAALRPPLVLAFAPGDVLVLLSDGLYEWCDARGEAFGEARVREVVRAHHGLPTSELAARLLEAVQAFAGGAPQEDDVTLVLVKREPAAARAFARRVAALDEIVAFTADFFARAGLDAGLRPRVDLALEELFTNLVKYGGGSGAVRIELARVRDGVAAALIDDGVERFDVTAAPDVDIAAPIGERRPGGLGLHLVRRLVDSIEYGYSAQERRARIAFTVTANAQRRDPSDARD